MKCASCSSARVFPSRLRNSYERIRVALTGRHPHRCHDCGWRKWAMIDIPEIDHTESSPDALRIGHDTAPVKPTELDELDPVRSRQ